MVTSLQKNAGFFQVVHTCLQRACDARMVKWSMSGLVRKTWPWDSKTDCFHLVSKHKAGITNFKMQRQVRKGANQWFDNIVPCIMLSFRIWTRRIQAIVGGVLELSASSCCKPSRMISIGVLDHLWACRHQMCIRRDQGKPDTKLSSLYNDL